MYLLNTFSLLGKQAAVYVRLWSCAGIPIGSIPLHMRRSS
jgi:hypothetical protein